MRQPGAQNSIQRRPPKRPRKPALLRAARFRMDVPTGLQRRLAIYEIQVNLYHPLMHAQAETSKTCSKAMIRVVTKKSKRSCVRH
jgi:hypothetical protein